MHRPVDLVARLWDICQVPDYRKIAPANHAELVTTVFGFLARDGKIPDDWFASQVAYADRDDGDIDTLSNRIAHIRTWTFVANRPNWLDDPLHWQERTRAVEDRLSDALHERLTARFVDRRTSVLMRRLKEKAMLEAEISQSGDVLVEGQLIGRLSGFRFEADAGGDGTDARALRSAAAKALAGEIAERAERVATSVNNDFVLASDGTLRWRGAAIARIAEGDDALRPRLILLADDVLAGGARERVQARIELWLASRIETVLKPLVDLRAAETLAAAARGVAFRLVENLGIIDRVEIAEEVRSLDQESRAGMRTIGVRFGAHHIYVPQLLKPGPSALLATLWSLKNGSPGQTADLIQLAASGRTSFKADPAVPRALYRVVGYRVAGNMAVRIDIVERLADLIRPLIAWRPTPEAATQPEGAADGNGFRVTVAMTSLLGCSGEDFASVLRSLGYRMERRPAPVDATVATASDAGAEATPEAAEPGAQPLAAAETSPPASTADAPEPAEAASKAEAAVAAAEPAEAQAALEPAVDDAAVAPEPPADTAVAGEPPAAEAAAEPAFIEIWRPHRPHHRRPEARRDGPRKPREPQAVRPEARAPDGDRPPRPPRRERSRNERPGGDRRARQGERSSPRDPPRVEQREREKPIDPNSPFAALAALKAQLEAQKRNG